ncbi:hypothetical protein GCM10029976_079400 [Kribbella albertanoniae]
MTSPGTTIGRNTTSRPNSPTSQSIDDRIHRRRPPANRSRGNFNRARNCCPRRNTPIGFLTGRIMPVRRPAKPARFLSVVNR